MSRTSQTVRKLMQMLAHTHEREMDCGEVFAVLDAYTEAVARGDEVSELYSQVLEHMELCPDCVEEYAALLEVIQSLH